MYILALLFKNDKKNFPNKTHFHEVVYVCQVIIAVRNYKNIFVNRNSSNITFA